MAVLIIEAGILCIASRFGFGAWFPPPTQQGFWFYAALLSLILGNRIVTPFYSKPADAMDNSGDGV